MFGLEIIEVAVGLVFTYLVLSMVCSGIFEVLSRIAKMRARYLEQGLRRLLADREGTGFVKQLYGHYLIRSPLEDKVGKPEHIDAADFATAVFDLLAPDATSDAARIEAIREGIAKLPDPLLRKRLLAIMHAGEQQLGSARDMVEQWFDHSMEAVTAWYKRRAQVAVLICSVLVTAASNADSLRLARTLWNDDELRAAMTKAAESYAEDLEPTAADPAAPLAELQNRINDAKTLPIGWTNEELPGRPGYGGPAPPVFWVLKLAGLLLTVGAVSLGSSYWYTVLRKLLELASRRRGERGQTVVVVPPGGAPAPAGGTS